MPGAAAAGSAAEEQLQHTTDGATMAHFALHATDGLARLGKLVTKHGTIHTPASLIYTRRGNSLYLTPDMLQRLKPLAEAVQIDAMHFLENPDPATLAASGGGAREFLALQGFPIIATNRDPTYYEYGARPSTATAVHAMLPSGGMLVSPERYISTIQALQPDAYVALADECYGDAKPKRAAQSVERTSRWLRECVQLHTERRLGAALLAPVTGAAHPQERARSAREAAQHPEAAGFALCGFGTGESRQQAEAAISAAVAELPADKPRLISNMATPEEVLAAVVRGVDLFDTSYVATATAAGMAAAFPVSPEQEQAAAAAAGSASSAGAAAAAAAAGEDPSTGTSADKLNLWSLSYRLDKGPLVPGCSCFACQNHSRAYVHHLLHVHEMLADVLLEVHNTHHWQLFFQAMRAAIAEGRLQQYSEWFGSRRAQAPPGDGAAAAEGAQVQA